jgi:hypothetical protein
MQNITITENGVYKLLRNIKSHKATGPDNIQARYLKELALELVSQDLLALNPYCESVCILLISRCFMMLEFTICSSVLHSIAGADPGFQVRAANNKQIYIILLDFSKAFEKVPHKRLFNKLNYYGIRSNTLQWIYSML